MNLEVIERGRSGGSGPPLLFVHGYWQAAWTWDERVLPALADLGHHCVAVSLTGHGGSHGKIRGTSISDYVSDVAEVANGLQAPPVVIGHSMGGFTTQHYLAAGHPARAAVLVSPVPRKGAWGATLKVIRRHPWRFLKANLTLDVGAIVETEDAAYDLLISRSLEPGEIRPYLERLERASYRTYIDLLMRRPDLSSVDVPALVIGGADDGFFTEAEWRDTAAALGADLVMLEGVGHQPMWEGGGARLIEEIDGFVRGLE